MSTNTLKKILFSLSICWVVCACEPSPGQIQAIDRTPDIFPNYQDVTIPPVIAPLNFEVKNAVQCIATFYDGQTPVLKVTGKKAIIIPEKKWQKLLAEATGQSIQVEVCSRLQGNNKWVKYNPFNIRIALDSIDPYIVYRLIEPGYEVWNNMEIARRDLRSFDEKTIIHNSLTENGCVNCHSFHNYSPEHFMFHARKANGGTIIVDQNTVTKVDLSTKQTTGQGVYPMWHPSGRHIVFSVNVTNQAFHSVAAKKIEVYDQSSDLIIYNVQNKQVLIDKRFNEKNFFETFPAWSPDGKWLYFCRARAKNMPFDYQTLKYGIYRVAFDETTGRLADSIETVVDTLLNDQSASFPRLSPDGRYLLYTLAACGTFPIWHREADLKMLDLTTGKELDINAINSDETESYHSWSSNGRWIIFSSRRMDGQYTHLYMAYFDRQGHMHKPFLLPQRDPEFYSYFLKSYNIPEFIKADINISPYQLEKTINGKEIVKATTSR